MTQEPDTNPLDVKQERASRCDAPDIIAASRIQFLELCNDPLETETLEWFEKLVDLDERI